MILREVFCLRKQIKLLRSVYGADRPEEIGDHRFILSGNHSHQVVAGQMPASLTGGPVFVNQGGRFHHSRSPL